jgi:NAD+-dependent protein deacetylase sirtuin 1
MVPNPRPRLSEVETLDDAIQLIERAKRIIVVTGAGISVSTGIPDFRSKEGLYNTLDCTKYGIPSAELLFDIEFFNIDPAPFYQFASTLLPDLDVTPSVCHRFLALLQARKKLLRNYTQNVDGLERKVGLTNLVECHGTMDRFHCTGAKCTRKQMLAEVMVDVHLGNVCYCKCGEVMKPAVTFFGEQLPKILFTTMAKDLPKCDLVLVIGTSLKVGGSVHEVLRSVDPSVPQVLINREVVTLPSSMSEGFDVSILGQCDDIARYLCARLDWEGIDIPDLTLGADLKKEKKNEIEVAVARSTHAESNKAVHNSDGTVKTENELLLTVPSESSTGSKKRKRLSKSETIVEANAAAVRVEAHMDKWKCEKVAHRVWSCVSVV